MSRPIGLKAAAHVQEFTLVPWRAALERTEGKSVSGIVREGGVSWTIGRGRQGPSVG